MGSVSPAGRSLLRRGFGRLKKHARWMCSRRGDWLLRARSHRWVFVVGCNRSGKTIVSNLLAAHPLATVVPNASWHTRALPDSRSLGVPHVWAEKIDRFRLTETSSLDPAPRLAYDWLHYSTKPGPVIVVESDVAAVQMPWLQRVFPDARFIGLLRNGYAVAGAIRAKEGYAIARCARQWRIATETMLADAELVPFELVRYERLAEDPAEVLERLAEVCELDPEPLRPLLAEGWRLGNQDRSPRRLRNANAEEARALTEADRSEIRKEASALLDRFSYGVPDAVEG